MRVEQIHPNHVVALWPQVENLLGGALEHAAGEYTLDQLKAMLVSGAQALLVSHDESGVTGATTVETCRFPNKTIAYVTAIGGRGIATPEAFAQLKAWCQNNGHTHIRGAVFESIARLWKRFEAKEIYRIVEIDL